MDIDNTAPFVGFEIDHRLAELNAGVVDENVDFNAGGVEMLESGENRLFVRDVESVRFDLMPSVRKSLGGLGELVLVAAVENDLAPASASPRAIESPSPSEDPVTRAVLPLRSNKLARFITPPRDLASRSQLDPHRGVIGSLVAPAHVLVDRD